MKTAIKLALSTLALCALSAHSLAQELRVTVWTGSEAHLKMLNGIAQGFIAKHPGVTAPSSTPTS
ncbi:hypothetical protein [Mesorhizobium sp. B1-1-6]|uniref:hypothetical protein n=1 Tax=Mesorhizobium sp. B1-1-6 TaxID=2589978 RepID=UPI0015E459A4|nr:hypothetical protein [Mesorhizobium sp. B1-1-6]